MAYRDGSELDEITLFNPREDIVGHENIYFLITEKGSIPPQQIPEIVKKEYEEYKRKYRLKRSDKR